MTDCDMLREIGIIPDSVKCCSSCHTDMEYGYDACFIEIGCCEYEVCCAVNSWWLHNKTVHAKAERIMSAYWKHGADG